MTRIRAVSVSGGVVVPETDSDNAYADFIALDEKTRIELPKLRECKGCGSLFCGPARCRFTPEEPKVLA